MLLRLKLPKTILWVINLLLIYVLLFTFFRLVTFIAFSPGEESFLNILPSFLLGLRFDLRWISLLLLPIILVSFRPELSPFYSVRNKKCWTWYLAVVTFVVIFFFAADYGCFSYNKTRLNASALNFAEDPVTSLSMLWESYPLLLFLFALCGAVLMLKWMFRQTHGYVITRTHGRQIPYERKWFVLASLALGLMIYGSTDKQPLKWKTAFSLQDSFQSYLALNPMQNFFATLKFRKPQFDDDKAKANYALVKNRMGLSSDKFDYKRTEGPGSFSIRSRPNIVLVLCESFSMYKSSMSGNPLNTTPFFDSLCAKGVFFDRCFTPHFSTARGLFATVTGIPDVQLSKFSTRNPQALDQHTIINTFKGYRKFYFLGGNPAFNNFEGLLSNVDSLTMVTEGHFTSEPVNVWGISDKDLFAEANKTFARQTVPFFAIVQSADNHRPFTIPEGDAGFRKDEVPADTLVKYGFESVDEYNSFRYTDYCFQQFIQAARNEPYFDNTLFVFVGDHGVSGNAAAIYPGTWTSERLTDEHVPLLFYAPKLLQPQRRGEVVSQVDVLPTIAGLTGYTYINTTLGRNILTQHNKAHYAFIITHDEGRIGLVTDSFYFTKNLNFTKEDLYPLSGSTTLTRRQQDSVKAELSPLTTAFYETAKWMLVHNQRKNNE